MTRAAAAARATTAARIASRALAAAVAAAAAILLTAGPASAHADLLSTNPVAGAVLATSPTQVVLDFDEAVEIDLGSIRVLSTTLARVDEGNSFHPNGQGSDVAVGVQPHLPDGTYIVAWRVISDDSHPVHGAFVFSVGTATGAAHAEKIAASIGTESAGSAVGISFWVVRAFVLASLIVLVGTTFAVAAAWPGGWRARRVRRVVAIAWLLAVVSTILAIGLQGVYASALPFWDLARPSLVSAVLHTRYGEVALIRLALLLASVPVLAVAATSARHDDGAGRPRQSGRIVLAAAGVPLGLALLATPGLSGHAAAGIVIGLGIPADILHLAAASAWVGGLLVIGSFLVPGLMPEEHPADSRAVMLRISAIAFGSVAVIVVSGVVLALRQIGSWPGLFSTTYGQLLIAKSSIVLVVVLLGALARHALHGNLAVWRRAEVTEVVPRRRLSFGVLSELALIAVVLAVTAALINSVPPRELQAQPFTQTWNVLGVQVNAIIEPAIAGPGNQFHFYVLGPGGGPKAIPELDAQVSLPSRNIGPISIPLVVAGPGHYQDNHVDIPLSGSWRLRVTVRTTGSDQRVVYATLPVR